jgi:hypothetical protein
MLRKFLPLSCTPENLVISARKSEVASAAAVILRGKLHGVLLLTSDKPILSKVLQGAQLP